VPNDEEIPSAEDFDDETVPGHPEPEEPVVVSEVPICDARLGERLASQIAGVSGQLEHIYQHILAIEDSAGSDKPAATVDPILSQVLAVARETLVRVSAPSQSASDLIEPLIRDLVVLVFTFDQLLQAQPNGTLEALQSQLVTILERYGAEFYAPAPGDLFAGAECQAVKSIQVADRERDGRIAAVVRRGCRFREKRLFYPQVEVARYVADTATN
jgi:hypothetical protein